MRFMMIECYLNAFDKALFDRKEKRSVVKKFLMIAAVAMMMTPPMTMVASAQSSDSNSALLARQTMRLNNVEESLKDVRGTVETELRAIRLQLEQMSTTALSNGAAQAASVKDLKGKISELSDDIAIFNQRLRRSIEMASDIEFRVLRMEKRMQTLLSLSGDNLANAILQDDVTAGGTAPSVSMSRDADTGGSTWLVEKDEVAPELEKITGSEITGASEADNDNVIAENTDNNSGNALLSADADAGLVEDAGGDDLAQSGVEADAQADLQAGDDATDTASQDEQVTEQIIEVPSVLPDASPEEQYRFALGRALQNDLETAEAAFAEFRDTHQGHERAPDVLYWLGRVQFIQGSYEKSAMTFTEFNSEFPADSRLPDAILMIAESVANFATAEQACQIFADLPQLLDQPPESFVKRLGELKTDAACAS